MATPLGGSDFSLGGASHAVPTAPYSSIRSTDSSPPVTNASERDQNNIFIVHSCGTLGAEDRRPRDDQMLARPKRRRTSPEDLAVLEAEYRCNPKPDKSTRMGIVERVTMGEKEVQIWFQNRRQNDRRKYKPLQQDKPSSEENQRPDASASAVANVSQAQIQQQQKQHQQQREQDTPATPQSNMKNARRASVSGPLATPQGSPGSALLFVPVNPGSTTGPDQRSLTDGPNQLPTPVSARPERTLSAPAVNQNKPAQPPLNPRTTASTTKAPPSLRISLSGDGEAVIRKAGERTPSHRKKKERGPMRISLSADGEALVRMANEPSPLKSRDSGANVGDCPSPLSAKRPANGLRRCHSAVSMRSLNGNGPNSYSAASRMFGRSQDSRLWELFCNDTDARSALSSVHNLPAFRTPANKDQHAQKDGAEATKTPLSSIDANRNQPKATPTRKASAPSSSQQSATTTREPKKRAHKLSSTGNPRSSKRTVLGTKPANACNAQQSNTSAPVNPGGGEPSVKRKKLSRVVSSAARLESTNHSALKPRPKNTATMTRLHSGDSDKENWIPGPPPAAARVGGGSPTTGNTNVYASNNSGSFTSIAERSDTDMGSSSFAFTQSSQDEDLDCIQGLLSLSQGAWN